MNKSVQIKETQVKGTGQLWSDLVLLFVSGPRLDITIAIINEHLGNLIAI